MNELSISIRREKHSEPDGPHGICVNVGETVLTKLLRSPGNIPDKYLLAPPAQLAFWLADNWWRLRWECIPSVNPSSEWRLSHEISSLGAYAWPRLAIWGDNDRIGISSKSDPIGIVGPVRFLTDSLYFIDAIQFETAIDHFFDQVTDEVRGFGSDKISLQQLVTTLKIERTDPNVSQWRRLEARLGFDPDEAPEDLVESAGIQSNSFGQEAVEEAIMAAPGIEAIRILNQEIEAARASRIKCDFSSMRKEIGSISHHSAQPPWITAEQVAQKIRIAANMAEGPITNRKLAEIIGISEYQLRRQRVENPHPYGLRLAIENDDKNQAILLRTSNRRFELCRALGDAMWSNGTMGPLANSKTVRQKFQRAFAQSLLCPFDDLRNYLNNRIDDDGIAAAARHFDVSEWVVRTLLANKGVISQNFEEQLEVA